LRGMPMAWHIIAEIHPVGRESGASPFREYFVVGMTQPEHAVESLRMRRDLSESKLTVVGEATPAFIENFNIKEGEIFSVGLYAT
jgi:hypothetical protein